MALTITYNATRNTNLTYIYRATSGGTVFSANLTASTAFDLFSDTAVANDAIYFAASTRYGDMSDFKFNIGTAMAGTDIVLIWEYTRYRGGSPAFQWVEIPNTVDNTNQFTNTGEQIFEFPYPPHFWDATINGVTTGWIRCRIVSLTAITEGGANQTTRIQTGDGFVRISGTTESVPATWTNVYDWIVANKPHLSPTKLGNVFMFPHCSIYVGSVLRSTNEIIMQGNGHGACRMSLDYIYSGIKYGDYNAYSSSSYFNDANLGTARFYFSATAGVSRVYGGVFGGYIYDDGYNAILGYSHIFGGVAWNGGEYIQVQYKGATNTGGGFSGYLAAGASMKNCSLSGEFTTTGFPTSATALDRVSVFGGKLSMYTAGNGTLRNLSLVFTGSNLLGINTNIGNQKVYFIDPLTVFPEQTTVLATSFIDRSEPTLTNITKVLFYDDSAGTYTDYTTQAQSTTADDVPINGDVDDIIYFLAPTVNNNFAPALSFDLTNTSNNYVYQWQVYTSAGWENCDKVWDLTNNFTTNDKYIYIKNSISTGSDGNNKRNHASVTINGTAGYWFRLKIITKGTGTPTFSRVRSSPQLGLSEWRYYQQFSANFKVLDENNTVIEGATVVMKNKNGDTLFTATTNSSGVITEQVFTQRDWFFDPINYPTLINKIGFTTYSPFEIYITKTGYETYYIKKDITAKVNETIALKKAVPLLIGVNTGKDYLKLNPDNLNSREIIID